MKRPAWKWLLSEHQRTDLAWLGAIHDLEPSDSPTSIDIKSRCATARKLVRAARSAELFTAGEGKRKLVIVGSGPAAIAAALYAAKYKIPSYIVERKRTLANQFAQCKCRYVHPNIYQWPQPIADKNHTGFSDDEFSLYWEAGPVAAACRQWRMRWSRIGNPRVALTRFIYNTDVTFATMEEVFKKISPDLDGPQVGMVLFCGGFNEASKCEGQADSAPFWGNDCIAEPHFGNEARKQTVCISGGGNGGIQDFLRSVSKHSILDLKEWWRTHYDPATRAQWVKLEAECLRDLRSRGYYLRRGKLEIELTEVLRDHLERYFPALCEKLREFAGFAFDRVDEVASCTLLTRGSEIDKAYPLNIIFLLMLVGASDLNPLSIKFNRSTLRVILQPDQRREILFTGGEPSIVTDILIVRHGVQPHRMR
jgi:hypothetical protein